MKLVVWFLFALTTFSSIHTYPSPIDEEVNLPGSAALDNFPVIDGHNDLPYNLYTKLQNKVENFEFEKNLTDDPIFGKENCNSCFTDLPRLRQGKVGGQFWAAYVGCSTQYKNAVTRTMEQIDVIKKLVNKYPGDLEFVTTSDGILKAIENKKIASLIGVEGGHSIDYRLSVLRLFYELGVRYLTLTHNCNTPWADASTIDNESNPTLTNLTDFGKTLVLEMNRLGMMIDLAHVSHGVMAAAIDTSKAPVMFSHSSAKAIYAHNRNVADDILKKVAETGGIVMVNFYDGFIGPNANISDVARHINHIAEIASVDNVGLGGDYDGVSSVAKGLDDVSKYPDLFDLLKNDNPERWTIPNLEKLAGRNLIRLFQAVEKVKNDLSHLPPYEDLIPETDLEKIGGDILACTVNS